MSRMQVDCAKRDQTDFGPTRNVDVENKVLCVVLNLLGGSVLGDGFGALGNGVLGQFSGEEKANSGLNLPGSDGGALVVVRQAACLGGDALEDVVDKAVHDGHGLAGDSGIGMNLLEDLVDVDAVGFLPLLLLNYFTSRTTQIYKIIDGVGFKFAMLDIRRFWRPVPDGVSIRGIRGNLEGLYSLSMSSSVLP
jgi:hypothetical protein